MNELSVPDGMVLRNGVLLSRASKAMTAVHENRGGWHGIIREPFTGAWQRNQEWTTASVLAHHAVYACITRIAQDIGKLRPKLVEQDEDGIWTEVTSPAFSPVLRRPNRFQNHIQFKEWWTTSKLMHGNAYALLRRDGRGIVDAMYLLDPSRVQVLVAPDGEVFYQLRRDDLSEIPTDDPVAIPASEIIHDRINCLFHPLVGVSPIFACGTAANMGLHIEQGSDAFFGNGSNPGGILSSPISITPTKSKELSEAWNSAFAGGQSGKVAVLGDGMKYEVMRMTAVDSQLIEQLEWTSETVCSTFHVPPFKVGVGAQPTYANAEIANQVYYSDCLQALIEQYELCMDEALGLTTPVGEPARQLGVELDLDGLLRMDTASQVTTLAAAVSGSLLAVNEARKKLDQKPVPGGNSIWMQQQNYSLEALAERDRNDPFAKPPPPAVLPPAEQQKLLPPAPDDEADRVARLQRRVARRARTLRVRTIAA